MNDQLILRFLTGQCTSKELEEIDLWISLDEANAKWLFDLEQMWALRDEFRFADEKELQTAFNRLKTELVKKSAISEKTINVEKSSEQKVLRKKRYSTQLLTWSMGVAAAALVLLLSVNLWQLIFIQPASLNVVEVPRGSRAVVSLSDDTKVWLNSGSKLIYPQEFANDSRLVTLEGEGFFDVTKDAKHPFIVHSDQLQVKVLGTKFVFKAYPSEASFIYLQEGAVEVGVRSPSTTSHESLLLSPNDIVYYSDAKGFSTVEASSSEAPMSWMSGGLIFVDETLEDIVRTLERYFNVSINFEDDLLRGERYNCRVQENESLYEILHLLKKSGNFDYRSQMNQITLFKKK